MRSKFEVMRANRERRGAGNVDVDALKKSFVSAFGFIGRPQASAQGSVERPGDFYAPNSLPEKAVQNMGLGARCLELAPAEQRKKAELHMAAFGANVGVGGLEQRRTGVDGSNAGQLSMRFCKLGQKLSKLFRRK